MAILAPLGSLHRSMLHPARVQRLVKAIAPLLPGGPTELLDVGCGDGHLAVQLAKVHGQLAVKGIDVLIRPEVHIPVTEYDGLRIPLDDKSVDATLLADVLHHSDDMAKVLSECCRVSRKLVIVKDHVAEGPIDQLVLKAMDWVGNRHSGVALPYKYPSADSWHSMFKQAGLKEASWTTRVPVYRPPVSWVAGRDLHLLASLQPQD